MSQRPTPPSHYRGTAFFQQLQKQANGPVLLERMAERQFGMHDIMIPAAYPLARDITFGFEIRHDPLRSSFRYPHLLGDIAKADLSVVRYAQQNMRMVRQECPPFHSVWNCTTSQTGLATYDSSVVYSVS